MVKLEWHCLTKYVLLEFLMNWLPLTNLMKFDTSLCNSSNRTELHSLYACSEFCLHQISYSQFKSKSFLYNQGLFKWLARNKIKTYWYIFTQYNINNAPFVDSSAVTELYFKDLDSYKFNGKIIAVIQRSPKMRELHMENVVAGDSIIGCMRNEMLAT